VQRPGYAKSGRNHRAFMHGVGGKGHLTLSEQIYIVLNKEHYDSYGGITYAINHDKSIIYPHFDTLKEIYSNIFDRNDLQKEFVNILENEIIDKVTYLPSTNSELCIFTLAKFGFVDEIITQVNKINSSLFKISGILLALLEENVQNFNTKELTELEAVFLKINETTHSDQDISASYNILKRISKVKYENLRKVIKSINIEINVDKRSIVEKVNNLGFKEEYGKLLDEIDEYLYKDTSSFVISGMIGNLRSFMEGIFRDVGSRIATKLEIEIPKLKDRSEMGNIRSFIKEKLDLHENEDKFINYFIKILHNEGGHSFTTEKEYFRLSRNIAIEIALLLLSKFEKNFAN